MHLNDSSSENLYELPLIYLGMTLTSKGSLFPLETFKVQHKFLCEICMRHAQQNVKANEILKSDEVLCSSVQPIFSVESSNISQMKCSKFRPMHRNFRTSSWKASGTVLGPCIILTFLQWYWFLLTIGILTNEILG